MPLNPRKLSTSIQKILESKETMRSYKLCEEEYAKAYDSYARDATDASGDKLASANPVAFRSALVFSASLAAPVTAAQFELAFLGYWLGATFQIGVPPSPAAPCPSIGGNTIFGIEASSVVSVVIPGIMLASLMPVFLNANKQDTPKRKADAIAKAMHLATTTAVQVLITGLDTTPPPAGPLPITNLCGIR